MTQPRINYPTRTLYFAREAGLQTAEQQEQLWEDLCEERLQRYRMQAGLVVEDLLYFFVRFGLMGH
jgi:hypothetical protein